jgi:predicted alpha/beta-fold hydrolase
MNSAIETCVLQGPFVPHRALKSGHAQTIVAALIPRRFKMFSARTERRLFEPGPGIKVLALCSWQRGRLSKPTLVVVHGMEGSADSSYMLGTAEKAFSKGFNVLRINIRNCGGTEGMSPTLYHAGMTEDLRHIVTELIQRDGLREIYLTGFSLGGNIVLKLAGEYECNAPEELRGLVAVSPSVDLLQCITRIELRSNLLYHLRFVRSLRIRMRRKARLFPDRYDPSLLQGIWSIRQFDDAFTAPHCGFLNADDYYKRASSLPLIERIALPTLIIHAKDDPFIPYAPLEGVEVSGNPNIMLLAPDVGGHVGFVADEPSGVDRFWAEAKAVEFLWLLSEMS